MIRASERRFYQKVLDIYATSIDYKPDQNTIDEPGGQITYHGIRRRGRAGWYALPAVLSIAVALFAQELSAVHVPGIWFPFGTGVSRTQYAYAVFDIALASVLWHRLRGYARHSVRR
jgi:predicted membrane channel-forming protein YqfA (hemolysin III family)